MEPAIAHALASALTRAAKKDRGNLAPGQYEVDETVALKIHGTVAVSEDETYTPTTSIPFKVTMALFMRYAGVTGSAAMEHLVAAMNEALRIEGLTGKEKKNALAAIREIADLEAAEERVQEGLDKLDDKTRLGKVIVKAEVEEVALLKPPTKAADELAEEAEAAG